MSTKKKIAVIGLKGLPAFSGACTVAQNLIEHMTESYDFTVYAISSHAEKDYNPQGYRQHIFRKFPVKKFNSFYYYLIAGLHAYFFGKYDMIHLHNSDGAYILPLLRRKYPVMVTSHARPQESEKWGRLAVALFNRTEKTVVRKANILTVVSLKLKNYYEKEYGREVYYIPNGVTFHEDILESVSRENLSLTFAAGRIIPLKGCDTLLKALHKLKFTGPVKIIGDTEQMRSYTNKLRKLSEGLDVEFTGLIREKTILLEKIQRSQFFIFPSYNENMSIMLLEVATTGTPIICSDIPENKVIFNDEEVLFFKSEDHDDLADKIDWASSNYNIMLERSAKALEKVRTVFTYEKISLEYKVLLDSLLTKQEESSSQFTRLVNFQQGARPATSKVN